MDEIDQAIAAVSSVRAGAQGGKSQLTNNAYKQLWREAIERLCNESNLSTRTSPPALPSFRPESSP